MKSKKTYLLLLSFLTFCSTFTPSGFLSEGVDYVSLPDSYKFNAIGSTIKVSVNVLPESATDKRVTWTTSSSTDVSIISSTSTYAYLKCNRDFAGEVLITATTTNGLFSKTCKCVYLNHYYDPVVSVRFYNYYDEKFSMWFDVFNYNKHTVELTYNITSNRDDINRCNITTGSKKWLSAQDYTFGVDDPYSVFDYDCTFTFYCSALNKSSTVTVYLLDYLG